MKNSGSWTGKGGFSFLEPTLFGGTDSVADKRADDSAISRYFVKRLKTAFPYAAGNQLPLQNSTNCPLYLLCFAAGNSKGGPVAKRIAEHILKP